jgi:uncharacterized protein YggU (UPF0235/DUF167 family)
MRAERGTGGRRTGPLGDRPGPLSIVVQLTPRGGTDRIDRVEAGVIHARVAPPPADGAANDALLKLLASALGVARSDLRLVSGASARRKRLVLDPKGVVLLSEHWRRLLG